MPKPLAIVNEFGNVDLTLGKLNRRYVHVSGKRLQPLCRKLRIRFAEAVVDFRGDHRYGYSPVTDGVVVSAKQATRLGKALADRELRSEARKATKRRVLESYADDQRRNKREQRIKAELQKFPQLQREQIPAEPLITPNEAGYQHGLGTEHYWNQLGYRIVSKAVSAYLVEEKELTKVYCKNQLTERKSLPEDQQWFDQLFSKNSKEIAVAECLRFANRLQKVVRRADLYPLKDQWILENQNRLILGRVARVETRECFRCHGSGQYYGDVCWNCCDGIYSRRNLYEHNFEVDGRNYCFHSYVKPKTISGGSVTNKMATFGRPFNDSEVPLPPQSMLVDALNVNIEIGKFQVTCKR